ncbi:MAG: DUF3017 domain-containing protein [Streptosporangiaceae bacterium]
MANWPANAGAHSAGPHQGTQSGPAAAPPPVHHQDYPRSRRPAAATATKAAAAAKATRATTASQVVAWLPYLIVLAGTVAGVLVTRHAGRGAVVLGVALLVAALARLALPPRYSGLLVSRSKTQDVAGFAVFGVAVLALAASLP